MKHLNFKNILYVPLAALIGCATPPTETKQIPTLSVAQLNQDVKPGENFYAYANTHWMKANPIPDDKSRYGSFDELAENNKEQLKVIFQEASKNNTPGSIAKKIGDFYNSGMDTIAIEEEGLKNLMPILNKIEQIDTSDDLAAAIGYLHTYQLAPFFYYFASADKMNSDMNIANIYQNGLGLPDRDYYLQTDEQSEEIKKEYKNYIVKLLSYAGEDEANAVTYSNKIYDFEYKMADIFYTRLQNRDPHLTYNKIEGNALYSTYADFNWSKYFEGLQQSMPTEINIYQTSYLKNMSKLIGETSLDVVKEYLKLYTLRSMSEYLGSSFVNADFDFYGKVIQGKKSKEPRWKTVQGVVNSGLGEAIGQLYVDKYFPPKAKVRMDALVENIRGGFAKRLKQLDWMSNETKVLAQDKLAAISVKIGYPNQWRDYTSLDIVADSYIQNILNSGSFEFNYEMSKIGKPVDKEVWHMNPQTVNAYYNPSANEIVFPAAILQPPFFYMDGDDAVNYGAIGVVIAHEITHGFDDQGAKYDKKGNLNTWWTEEDTEKFNSRTQRLVDQFNNYVVIDTMHANGEFTLGENIADLGGLNISYTAYLNAISGQEPIAEIGGLTDKQRFFLAYSAIWAQNIREKEIVRRTKTDPHSLGKLRVNGPLPNMQEFYDAFGIDENAEIYIKPDERALIW
ncbi:M13 family metallopeptidase [Plebeiibacterium marinum]|uniref:M13 family metallopeptidase n=1 Tax=Plebeiibacterium marinum TaxID=2992111 RepID=A0AAE3ME48_9BACT|nr:M13 family metallopeptidase [Plebeiobacterium marinum]MCW3805771.1 M13 family metallopeptidase [Plebeiobacterium marinum]